MLDNVSPIVYKKIAFDKFNTNSDNFLNSKTSTFYDQYSQKFILINQESIRIFNKEGSDLLKVLKLTVGDSIDSSCVDIGMNFLVITVKKSLVIIVNIRSGKVMDMISLDLNLLLGSFFYTNEKDEVKFCLIFKNKIEIFKLNFTSITENAMPEKTISIPSQYNITYYSYDINFMILMIRKEDTKSKNDKLVHKLEFICLDDKKYSKFTYDYVIKINNNGTIGKLMNYFYPPEEYKETEKLKKSMSTTIKPSLKEKLFHNHENKNNGTQFYLTTLYGSLYLICVNFEERQIQINHIKSPLLIERIRNVCMTLSCNCSLQFFDNLIVYHDYEKHQTLALDLKSEVVDKPLGIFLI